MVVGRGSFIESFPLFGLKLEDYDSLFAEKLDLLLKIRENEHVHWSGKHRAALTGQGVYPRAVQNPLPIWLGVGGTPQSFARAGALGLPLMVAIIGGEPRRFRPLVDLYRETGKRFGYAPDRLRVGVHALGYVAPTTQQAIDDFFPGYARAVASVAKERGWPAVTRADFDAQRTPEGALLVGDAEEVVEKIVRYNVASGAVPHKRFYEKVIKVKADVAALLYLISVCWAFGTSAPPPLRFLVFTFLVLWWLSPHFHRKFGVRIAQERRLATRSTHSTPRLSCRETLLVFFRAA